MARFLSQPWFSAGLDRWSIDDRQTKKHVPLHRKPSKVLGSLQRIGTQENSYRNMTYWGRFDSMLLGTRVFRLTLLTFSKRHGPKRGGHLFL